MRFSPTFRSFGAWLAAGKRSTAYAQKVIRLHQKFPAAPLAFLRNLGKSGLDPSRMPFSALTAAQKDLRHRALLVLSNVREGQSLRTASKQEGISIKEVLKHIGRFLYKRHGKWVASDTDNVERSRWFFSKGQRISIIVTNSKDASLISQYLSAVRHALHTGDEKVLKPFKWRKIRDADGKKHSFETRLNVLYELHEQIEHSELGEIYDHS